MEGLDTFQLEPYRIPGEFETEELAEQAAQARIEEIECRQPSEHSGGQEFGAVQDKVFVVRPDGSKYQFFGRSRKT